MVTNLKLERQFLGFGERRMKSERRKGMKREGEWEWGGELERPLKLLKETYFMNVEMSGMGETIKINFKHPSSCKGICLSFIKISWIHCIIFFFICICYINELITNCLSPAACRLSSEDRRVELGVSQNKASGSSGEENLQEKEIMICSKLQVRIFSLSC